MLSASFVRSPLPIKGFFAGPVSPVGIKPHPAVALVGPGRDPLREDGDPDILTNFIFAGEGDAAVSIGIHELAHTAKVMGIKGDPCLFTMCLMGWPFGGLHGKPPFVLGCRFRQHSATVAFGNSHFNTPLEIRKSALNFVNFLKTKRELA